MSHHSEENQEKIYVAYLRRSKKEQSSTLGIEAQQEDLSHYVRSAGGRIINTYVEIESGTRKKIEKRVVLQQAITECLEKNAILIIAKLDRLARDVEFISNLMNSQVKFIACDMPRANEFTVHIMAAVAEQEAKRISERTKSALSELKKRGVKLGFYAHKTRKGCPFDDDARNKAYCAVREKAAYNPNNMRGKSYAKALFDTGHSVNEIAKLMSQQGYASPQNKVVRPSTVYRWLGEYYVLQGRRFTKYLDDH